MMDTDETPRVAPSPLPPHSCRFIGHNKSDDWKEAIHLGRRALARRGMHGGGGQAAFLLREGVCHPRTVPTLQLPPKLIG